MMDMMVNIEPLSAALRLKHQKNMMTNTQQTSKMMVHMVSPTKNINTNILIFPSFLLVKPW
jgi:hypothetical protein